MLFRRRETGLSPQVNILLTVQGGTEIYQPLDFLEFLIESLWWNQDLAKQADFECISQLQTTGRPKYF